MAGMDQMAEVGFAEHRTKEAELVVVGVGGGGVNAVNRMYESRVKGVQFVAVNTDMQSLMSNEADIKIDIGHNEARGLGAGADPEVGKRAAQEAEDKIREALEGADMVFVTAGEGGGTGTGAAPIVARIAKEVGALTVGVVTKPFRMEGLRRAETAKKGIEELRKNVDTLIVIPNDRLLQMENIKPTVMQAYQAADQVLQSGVQGITNLITTSAMMNVDFADVRAIMKDAGTALMGIGTATGEDRVTTATEMAMNSPLLEATINGANGVLLYFQGDSSLDLSEVNEAASMVNEAVNPNANIILGFNIDDSLGDEVQVTLIAAGFDESETQETAPAEPQKPARNSGSNSMPVASGKTVPNVVPEASYPTEKADYSTQIVTERKAGELPRNSRAKHQAPVVSPGRDAFVQQNVQHNDEMVFNSGTGDLPQRIDPAANNGLQVPHIFDDPENDENLDVLPDFLR